MKPRIQLAAVLFACFLMPASGRAAADRSDRPSPGIVVEQVQKSSSGERAGLQPGDVLVSWTRSASPQAPAASGNLTSPFDLVDVFIEQIPRGVMTLRGKRGAAERSWVFPAGSSSNWEHVQTAPLFEGDLLDLYRQGKTRIEAGDLDAGLAAWRSAADPLRNLDPMHLATWLLAEGARALARAERWPEADAVYDQIIPPLEGTKAGDPAAAQLLREWGALFEQRYDWEREEDCYRRALTVDRRIRPRSLAATWSLTGRGYAANLSGGSKDHSAFFEQALASREQLVPGSSDVAAGWFHWGNAARLDNDFPRAVERYHHALELQQKLPGDALLRLEILNNLALVHYRQNDFSTAETIWRQALTLADQEAPEAFQVIDIAQSLGYMVGKRGDLPKAEQLLHRALDLCRRLKAPALSTANVLHDLGQVERQARKNGPAAEALCQACDLEDQWRRRVQGLEQLNTSWSHVFTDHFRECAAALLEVSQPENAFHAVEKGRARAFLDLWAERKLRTSQLSPGRAAEWQRLDAEYGLVEAELTRLDVRAKRNLPAIWKREGRLREIRRRKAILLQEDHPFTAVSYPEPLALAEARRQLDAGTVFLSYSTGPEKTLLFALAASEAGPAGWHVASLKIQPDELVRRVTAFRHLLISDRSDAEETVRQGQALYDLLVRPAEPLLSSAKRILIAADGPLHSLPFAALVRDGEFLAEWKPIHFTLSATSYAELKKERRPAADRSLATLVAFGDPHSTRFESEHALVVDTGTREAVRRGLAPLPSSREEVNELKNLFPSSKIYVGRQVTDEAVKKAVPGASFIHFAVHGLLNERIPLNSSLVLSLPQRPRTEKDNGLLQAWEVMEDLHLDADLVTLSACDTALGKEVGGEGLIGLTRAFQYAGARSVIATLWGIADRTTADFMKHLYTGLREGKSKDEALQAAQVAQIHSTKPQPFYWAAFQLYGDWN